MKSLPLDRDSVLSVFGGEPGRLMKAKEVGTALGLGPDARSEIRSFLRTLVAEGDLVAHPGRRFSIAAEGALVEGRVQAHEKGYGWLLPDEEGVRDAFIPPDEMTGIYDSDRVLCRISMAPKGPVAEVVKVLARGRAVITGTLRRARRALVVEPETPGMGDPILIPPGPEGGAEDLPEGSVVEVLIVQYPTRVTGAVGRVLRSLGKEGDLSVEVERIISEGGLVRPFSPEATSEAEALPSAPDAADYEGRKDVRELALCTIDGETAKDFDDAVYATRTPKGYQLLVAIADVSHYVTPRSALDSDARGRGTSVYYPGRCIPMLPEALSNGLCSLVPHVDRLCMIVEMSVSEKGKVTRARFFNGVMHSHARLTYTQVQAYFDGDEATRAAIPESVKTSLEALKGAAEALRGNRQRRGSLDFDFVERVIHVDEIGEPTAIHPQERKDAHRLIEDLMIAANEAVAERFEERGWPCVYRIHEPPDDEKLARFLDLARFVAKDAGVKIRRLRHEEVDVKALAELMEGLAEHRLKGALDYLLLRAMMQARYSADNVGHFGLGSEAYLHFTSPIRRYPDLIVHRELKRRLLHPRHADSDVEKERLESRLDETALACSDLERRAVDVERKISALYAAWFMREEIGNAFTGVVSGCAEFGAFVRLEDPDVEGLVHVATLGDRFEYDALHLRLYGERTGFEIGIGDRVEIEVANVDLVKRQVELRLVRLLSQHGKEIDAPPPSRREGIVDEYGDALRPRPSPRGERDRSRRPERPWEKRGRSEDKPSSRDDRPREKRGRSEDKPSSREERPWKKRDSSGEGSRERGARDDRPWNKRDSSSEGAGEPRQRDDRPASRGRKPADVEPREEKPRRLPTREEILSGTARGQGKRPSGGRSSRPDKPGGKKPGGPGAGKKSGPKGGGKRKR